MGRPFIDILQDHLHRANGPALRHVLRDLDVNHDNKLTFKELIGPAFMEKHCAVAMPSSVGYHCGLKPGSAPTPEYRTYASLQSDMRGALMDYMAYLDEGGRPNRFAVKFSEALLKENNKLMAQRQLPQLDPTMVMDMVDYAEAHLGEYRATGRVSLPAPRKIPVRPF